MRPRRWITVVAVSAVALGAIVYGFMPKPVPVDVVKAFRGPLKVTVEEEGTTRVADRFVLSSPVGGFMRRITIDVGDKVRKGQILAELESARSEPLDPRSVAATEAALASTEAVLKAEEERERALGADADYGQRSFDRSKKLFEDGLISRDALEQAETAAKRSAATLQSAGAAVAAARSEVERVRATLRHFSADTGGVGGKTVTVRAPAAGSVLRIHRESEGIVRPGDPLIDIGDPQRLEVKSEVLSTDAVRIKPGTAVLFRRWGGSGDLSGKVRTVEPAGFTKVSSLGVEEQRVLVIADITSVDEDRPRLGDGYRLEASFIIWEGAGVLQIPASALFRGEKGWAVFILENGKAVRRDVEVGHRTGLAAEVMSGLSEGEMVISRPDNTITHGSRVRGR